MNPRKHPELYNQQKEISFLCCDSDWELAHFLKISPIIKTPAHNTILQKLNTMQSQKKSNFTFIFQGGTHGLQIGQVQTLPAFLQGISHQIIIKSLWKVYRSFLSDRTLIFHPLWQLLCSGKYMFLEWKILSFHMFATLYHHLQLMPQSQTTHLTKPHLCILSNIKNVSIIWQQGCRERCHSVSLETCHVLLFLFHDRSGPATVVHFSLGTESFFLSLGSHMGYRCCYSQANFYKQFPVNFSVFSRDLNHS